MTNPAPSPNRKPLVFLYGDSIALPRHPDGVEAQDSMAELYAAHCAERGRPVLLYNRGESGKTIRDHWSKYKEDVLLFGASSIDILVLQLGVVDCAPRPLPPRVRRRLERRPAFIRQPIVNFIKNNRPLLLRWGFSFRKVEPDEFKAMVNGWIKDAITRFSRIAVVELPPVNEAAGEHSPGWPESVGLYNQILRDAVSAHETSRVCLVPLHEWLWARRAEFDTYISPVDGHHLLRPAHQAAFELLRDALES